MVDLFLSYAKMIKNLLGKKDQKTAPENNADITKLREKFNSIVASDAKEEPKPEEKTGPASQPQPVNQAQASAQKPAGQEQGYEYVDPGKVAENERITSLIMQQIKELIEIDNNLNAKNKELEDNISQNTSTLSSTKAIVEKFSQRLELIEKNMEKFMGLYEIVTNRFNPFVAEEEGALKKDYSAGGPLVEDAIRKDEPVEPATSMPAQPVVDEEVAEIMTGAGLQSRLDPEQQGIVKDELEKAIGFLGPEVAENAKDELAKKLGQAIGQELQKAMIQHIKLSNEELKSAMRDMLLEAISHIKQSVMATRPTVEPATAKKSPEYVHQEVHPDYHFYLPDGKAIKSIKGLIDALKTMDDKTFRTHVNARKNDFAEWIRVVAHKDDLADKIAKERTKTGISRILESL